ESTAAVSNKARPLADCGGQPRNRKELRQIYQVDQIKRLLREDLHPHGLGRLVRSCRRPLPSLTKTDRYSGYNYDSRIWSSR
ncbi:hypothetical protein BFJ71_g17372, partial [Fusarium oxysporum]